MKYLHRIVVSLSEQFRISDIMDSMDVEKLIAKVFEHPVLYDQSLSSYKDNEGKNNVLKKIASSLDASG